MPKAIHRLSSNVVPYDPIALFVRAAAQWPDRSALRVGGRTLNYRELDAWSNAIAERLLAKGAGGARVAFVAKKEAASYATILGIMKAGCAYVPLPPDGPAARWSAMLEQAEVRSMVGSSAQDGIDLITAEEGEAASVQVPIVDAEAYVLFTSGSTGGPKGVSVSRANVAAYVKHQLQRYDFNEQDRFSQFFALTFDLSVHDIFLCWSVGACLCVPQADDLLRAVRFAQDERITVWFSVPSLAMLMQRVRALSKECLPLVRLGFFCGEPMNWSVARAFAAAAPHARLVDLYGPTEATIAITAFEVERDDLEHEGYVPIGRPFAGSAARVVEGELQLSGPQLATGYVGDEAATRRSFITEGGERWYRTGDLVEQDADGVLHFKGRLDDQVKIMGHRVEPVEVDAVLGPLVGNAHVITLPQRQGDAVRLFTFITGSADHNVLMHELRRSLPAYMIPERIIPVEHFPMTAHGKLDRKALLALIDHG